MRIFTCGEELSAIIVYGFSIEDSSGSIEGWGSGDVAVSAGVRRQLATWRITRPFGIYLQGLPNRTSTTVAWWWLTPRQAWPVSLYSLSKPYIRRWHLM